MKKTDVTPEVQAQIEKLNSRLGKTHGNVVLNALGERTKSDPSAAVYNVDDELYVGEDVENLFMQSFNGRPTTGVVAACKSASGQNSAKALYFSALDRGIAEYGEDMKPTGVVVEAKTKDVHDVYDAVSDCANEQEVWNLLKGKSLKVAAINKVKAPRYNAAGQITGIRERSIPVFTFVK